MTFCLSSIGNGQQFFLANGMPNNGGLINTYLAGSTTPATTYTTNIGNFSNSNPIQLSTGGLVPSEIWLTGGIAYKFVITDSLGSVIQTLDNIPSVNDISALSASSGSSLIGFHSSAGRTVEQQLDMFCYGIANIIDPQFVGGADITGVADSTVAIQAALDSGAKLVFAPPGIYKYTQLKIRLSDIEFFGVGNSTVLNCTSTSVFCAIALVELYTGIYLHDFEMRGAISSEPAGPAPLRAIVNGTNTAGNAHTAQTWNSFNRFDRIHITGANPGTNGFNLGIQLNTSNQSTIQDCVIDSIYGTNSSFGYAVVCNGTGQQVSGNRFISSISGQGRHAVYLTDTGISNKITENYCYGWQNEAITGNTASAQYDLLIDGNTCDNCLISATGATAGVIAIIGSPYSKITNNTIRGSNRKGISIQNASYGTIATGNSIQNTLHHAIYILNSNDCIADGNLIKNPDSAGTSTYGGIEIETSNGVIVGDNRIDGTNYRFGVRINATVTVSNHCSILDNYISGTYSTDIENGTLESTNNIRRLINEPRSIAYSAGATTVSVVQNVRIITNISNAGAVTITDFTGGYTGQIVTMYFTDANTTISRANCQFAGGVNFVSTLKSTLTLLKTAGDWYEIARTTSIG